MLRADLVVIGGGAADTDTPSGRSVVECTSSGMHSITLIYNALCYTFHTGPLTISIHTDTQTHTHPFCLQKLCIMHYAFSTLAHVKPINTDTFNNTAQNNAINTLHCTIYKNTAAHNSSHIQYVYT